MQARPTFPLRLLLAAILVLLALGALLTLTYATDALLSIVDRLERLPDWMAWGLAGLIFVVISATAWLIWQLFRPVRARKRSESKVDRKSLEIRLDKLPEQATERGRLQDELVDIDRRAAQAQLYVAVFGEISTGKSSLVAALSDSAIERDVLGGTTREIRHYRCVLSSAEITLADVPGTNEERGDALAVAAREEAIRAHVVLLVLDGDLNRDLAGELAWLRTFDKPIVPVLTKIDRYQGAELTALTARLHERFGHAPVLCSGGGMEEVIVRHADGREEKRSRPRQVQTKALEACLKRYAARPLGVLETSRERAVLKAVDLRVGDAEAEQRRVQAEKIVREYARRAMLGAVAAVAPGSDLLIQGTLATLLVRRLTELYGARPSEVDLDNLVQAAGGRLRGGTALILAIAGNAAKAFPGLGTLGGGMLHALAYGMIFSSLGRALADTLHKTGNLDSAKVLQGFEQTLSDKSTLARQARALLPLITEVLKDKQPDTSQRNRDSA